MTKEFVILVDEQDNDIGVMEKIKAHQEGLLHRAFSVFIFNHKDELLLQQRSLSKYHSAGLWTNTCCSHPRPNETIKDAANRRLFEEMGMSCDLKIKTNFIYKTSFENGLIEHELDYVLIGSTNQNPHINKEEVENYKWMSIADIKKDIISNPNQYTSWFKIALEKVF
ncbi:MAG: isopentenyl-diphosphate delta-isomerase [Sphingobacteriaceae bacterium]|nr:isopentenyl-diphosphate delta-isomerase [Sphingobacteriaceae bacterium]